MVTKRLALDATRCAKRLWLTRNRTSARPELTPTIMDRIETGRRVGELARQRFPSGVLLEESGKPSDLAELTQVALDEDADVLFEPTFLADGCVARVDILEKTSDGWRVIEVKSSNRAKEEQIFELFFQVYVLEQAGLKIEDACLGLINTDYVYPGGEIDPHALLRFESFWDQREVQMPTIQERVALAKSILAEKETPISLTGRHCWKPDRCEFFDQCHVGHVGTSIFTLPRLTPQREDLLILSGCFTIEQIEDESLLTDSQKGFWAAVRRNDTVILGDLAEALSKIEFPALFIDFESVAPTLPVFAGTRPHESLVFQWSAHLLESPDTPEEAWDHKEFLSDGNRDPRYEFAESLLPVLDRAKSILHYASFERTQLRALAALGVPYGDACLQRFEAGAFDLERVIVQHVNHPKFEGKSSIKKVLPALVPGASYSGMAIADGAAAMMQWLKMIQADTDPSEREQIRQDLLAYCQLDTKAMVLLYQALRRLV